MPRTTLSRTELGQSDTKNCAVNLAYRGFGTLNVYTVSHRKYDGSWTKPLRRELFETGDAVVVLPYDPDRDEVVLIEQFRISSFARGTKPWLVECIAGRVQSGEQPEAVAVREAKEEANCHVSDLCKIGEMFLSPGIFAEYATMYCARTESAGLGGIHGLDTEEEDIRVLVVPFEDALLALDRGEIATSPAFICLSWLQRHRDQLRKTWR